MTEQRLIYASRLARGHWQDFDDDEGPDLTRMLQGIVRASAPHNLSHGVNSMLVAYDGWFIQALEGSAAGVRAVYDRIADDDRHTLPIVVRQGPIGTRAFGRWTMCARALSGADAGVLSHLGLHRRFDPVHDPQCPVLALLVGAARLHRSALDAQLEHLAVPARRAA